MRHAVLAFAALFALSCGSSKPKHELTAYDRNDQATYRVDIMPAGHGSGVVIHEDGYILTNQHVCGDGDRDLRIAIAEADEEPVRQTARALAWDEGPDLCVLKVDRKFENPAVLEDPANVKAGLSVYNIGFPYSFGKLVDRGIISAAPWNHPGLGVKNAILVRMEYAHPGSSGSGVYLVQSGKLIGLVKAIAWRRAIRGGTVLPEMAVKIVVGVDDIRRFLDTHKVPYHKDFGAKGKWSVPVGDPPPAYRIEIERVDP